MNKVPLFFLFISFITSNISSQSVGIGSRWTFSVDPSIQYPLYNKQYNFYESSAPIGKDWVNGIGFEVLKYSPQKNNFISINQRYLRRDAIFNFPSAIFLSENFLQFNFIFNKSLINKNPKFLDITKLFGGIGFSYSRVVNGNLNYYANNYTQVNHNIINKNRLELILKIGVLQDVFNISDRTSLSKFNLIIRLPVLNFSNTFSNQYQLLDKEIELFQKSNSNKITLEVQYAHLFDIKKRKLGKYHIKFDTVWTEVDDPINNVAPPIVNNLLPKKNFHGNFYYETIIYNLSDSILFIDNQKFKLLNKYFSGFGIGYTFNFLGNYSRDYLKSNVGGEFYRLDKGWRYNLFLSLGYRQVIQKASQNWENTWFFFPNLNTRFGVKFRNTKNYLDFISGFGYFKIVDEQTFLKHNRTPTPSFNNSSLFLGIGFHNHIFRVEYITTNFSFKNNSKSINFIYSLNI